MARKAPEQAIGMLREAEGRLNQGEKIGKIDLSRSWDLGAQLLPVAPALRRLKVDQARRLKDLERENRRLKLEQEILAKAVAWFAREAGSVPEKSSSS